MNQKPPSVLRPISDWLPLTRKEALNRGWDELDVVLITGDAYVDHPAFGAAVIARIIESEGLRVGIIAQPAWQGDLREFQKFGKPRLFFGVTAGNMDSMVNHYTASKRRRSNDAYTPGGEAGYRPDYAAAVYCKALKKLYPETPIILGGVEGSLRRTTHYDYWSDRLQPSILVESEADLLVYGMGEQPLRQILQLLQRGVPFESLNSIPQTAFKVPRGTAVPKHKKWPVRELASHEKCLKDKKTFARNFKFIEQESNKVHAQRLLQDALAWQVIINPAIPFLSEKELDKSFDLPYTRLPHPKYRKRGPIPAYEMIKFSVNMHRGCFGGCSFCTISAHQGKFVSSRSEKSIMNEVEEITKMPDFKGYLSDLGGPSANMYGMKGFDQAICDICVRPSCIYPSICKNLDTDHNAMTKIYQKVDAMPAIKKAFVSSGVRYDLLVKDYNKTANNSIDKYLKQLVQHHVSGRLKVAPEHTAENTLKIMRKPSFKHFEAFKKNFDRINNAAGLQQQLVPYFISSHPGSTDIDSAELAAQTKAMGFRLEQVQDFTPTPMTVATVIYYSGYHPYTLQKVETAVTSDQKKGQNMFFFWYKRSFRQKITAKLQKLGRQDLIQKLLS